MSILRVANLQFNASGTRRIDYDATADDGIIKVSADAVRFPVGSNGTRPPSEPGLIRYNSDVGYMEFGGPTKWIQVASNSVYDVANLAFAAANVAYNASNVSSNNANSFQGQIASSYASINSNWTVTNTVYGVANTALQNTNGITTSGALNIPGNLKVYRGTNAGGNLYLGDGTSAWTIIGNQISGGDLLFKDPSNSTTMYFSQSGGSVGIGTSSPSARIHLRQDQDDVTRQIIQNRNASGTPISELSFITGALDLTDSRYAYIQSAGAGSTYLAFGTSNGGAPTEKMRISSAGSVGVGTTSPSYKLHLANGNMAITSSTGAGTFQITDDSDLGRGLLLKSNHSGTGNTYIGTNSSIKNLIFGIDSVERMRLDTSGNFTTTGTITSSSRGITKGSMPSGSVLQVVQTVLSSTASYAPNGTEQQVTGLACSITPSSSTSKILIMLNINYSSGGTTYGGYFKRSGTVIGVGDAGASQQRVGLGMALATDGNQVNSFFYQYLDSPATTSSVAYTFWLNNDNTGTCFINRSQNDGNNNTGKRCISTVTLMEIAV